MPAQKQTGQKLRASDLRKFLVAGAGFEPTTFGLGVTLKHVLPTEVSEVRAVQTGCRYLSFRPGLARSVRQSARRDCVAFSSALLGTGAILPIAFVESRSRSL